MAKGVRQVVTAARKPREARGSSCGGAVRGAELSQPLLRSSLKTNLAFYPLSTLPKWWTDQTLYIQLFFLSHREYGSYHTHRGQESTFISIKGPVLRLLEEARAEYNPHH